MKPIDSLKVYESNRFPQPYNMCASKGKSLVHPRFLALLYAEGWIIVVYCPMHKERWLLVSLLLEGKEADNIGNLWKTQGRPYSDIAPWANSPGAILPSRQPSMVDNPPFLTTLLTDRWPLSMITNLDFQTLARNWLLSTIRPMSHAPFIASCILHCNCYRVIYGRPAGVGANLEQRPPSIW